MTRTHVVAVTFGVLIALAAGALYLRSSSADTPPAPSQPAATPVPVATVERREVTLWDEFSGRLEAVERVDVRSRVAGAVQSVHFAEGALVKRGDLLVTIDPGALCGGGRARAGAGGRGAGAPQLREDRTRARASGCGRSASSRGRQVDERVNAEQEADANLRAAQAALQSARLNLDYTRVRAPVSGRVGKLEITVGNLVAAGPGAPVLTTLVSVDPIYASFEADELVVARALKDVPRARLGEIPVEIETVTNGGTHARGRLQLIDNQVNTRSGTVRVRAHVRQPRRRPHSRPVREGAHGPRRRPSRRSW